MAKSLRGLGWAALVAVGVLTLIVAVFFLGRSSNPGLGSSSPTITQIQELGELVVLRVSIADVMEDAGFDYKGVWIVRGDAQLAVNLEEAELKSADEATKKLVVLLPQPRVIQPRVDHDKSRVFDVTKTTWIPFVGDRDELTNQGWKKAQQVVESACSGDELVGQAKDQTEFVLANMYRMVGWDVEVEWKGDSTASQ